MEDNLTKEDILEIVMSLAYNHGITVTPRGIDFAIDYILEKAVHSFKEGDDDRANLMRNLCGELKSLKLKKEKEVEHFKKYVDTYYKQIKNFLEEREE